MKSLEEAEVVGETATSKKVIPDGKNKGVVVVVHGANITVQQYKKKSGWTLAGYARHSARTWKGIASAILELTEDHLLQ